MFNRRLSTFSRECFASDAAHQRIRIVEQSNKLILHISDKNMKGGAGFQRLTAPVDSEDWDHVEALYGTKDRLTYLRFAEYLAEPASQRRLLAAGYRPADLSIALDGEGAPLQLLRIVSQVCDV